MNIGVLQGYVISPLLLNVVLDIAMRRATTSGCSITWDMLACLDDIDYADDICRLSHSLTDMTTKVESIVNSAADAGLRVSVKKAKSLRINSGIRRIFRIQDTVI